MNLLNKLTIKNLKLNRKRTVVTIIGIMLSVALITAVASIYESGIKSLITFEKKAEGDFHTVFYDVPVSDLGKFENNRNIETINITEGFGYAKIDSKNGDKPYAYVKGFTKDSLNNLSIRLVSGRLPKNDDEILIPTHLRTNGRLDFKINDYVTLEIGKRVNSSGEELNQTNPFQRIEFDNSAETLVDTKTKTYKIVGVIERPATNIEEFSAPGYTFVTLIDDKELTENVDIYVRLTKNGLKDFCNTTANLLNVDAKLFNKVYNNKDITTEQYDIFTEQLKNTYDLNINKYLIDLETDPISSGAMSGLVYVVGVVIGIIVFTSIFCIKNSFDISITEKIKQYGMLRSIGSTKKQIKRNVFYEATILGLIGIPLGILLGCFASFILIIISNYYLTDMIKAGFKLEFATSIIAVIFAVLLGIVTVYFSAFKSARKASKVTPIDSIRNSANIKINYKKIKSPRLIKKVFGIGGDISFKNLKRNKKKYRTTVISIVVSVFVFIALSGFMGLAFQEINNEIKVSDYNILLRANVRDEKAYNKYIRTTKLDNIDDYTILRSSELLFTGNHFNKEYIKFMDLNENDETNYITIYSLGTDQYKKYIKSLKLDYEDIKNKAILLDADYQYKYKNNGNRIKKYMRTFDFKKGEVINSKLVHNDEEFKIQIGEVTNIKPFGLKNMSTRYIVISDELFDNINEHVDSFEIYYKSNKPNKLQDDIDDYLKDEEEYYSVDNKDEKVKQMRNLFTLIGIFLYGFIIVISLIGITNIFNTITTNMELRKQEFAMLKSVGMTNKEFNRMIRLETLFMGTKSLLFGVPIGIALSYLIHIYFSVDSSSPYQLPLTGILISIFTVFILISLIMKYSMNKINKQNTIETIRNENI